MSDNGFDYSQVLSLINRLKAFYSPAQLYATLRKAGARAGVAAEALVRKYPPRSLRPLSAYYTRYRTDGTPYQSKFKTAKQQGWFFAALASGRLVLPYVRTGNMGGGIASRPEVSMDLNTTIFVGGTEPYTSKVIGARRGPGDFVEGMQSAYHAGGGWPIAQETIEANRGDLLNIYGESIYTDLDMVIKANTR